jgi:hypothetical protein
MHSEDEDERRERFEHEADEGYQQEKAREFKLYLRNKIFFLDWEILGVEMGELGEYDTDVYVDLGGCMGVENAIGRYRDGVFTVWVGEHELIYEEWEFNQLFD